MSRINLWFSVFLTTAATAFGQQTTVLLPVAHDISRPLREIAPAASSGVRMVHEALPVPQESGGGVDDALQTSVAGLGVPITNGLSFDGTGTDTGYTVTFDPSDANGSVGSTQYVQWVNVAFAIFDKASGSRIYGPALGNTIWSGFSGGNCNLNNDGDPIVLWDKQAQRWLFTQRSGLAAPFFQCVAVSQTADATGAYFRYAYNIGSNFNDYTKAAVWTDGYYLTSNLFQGNLFVGSNLCALDRATALAGGAATMLCFLTSVKYGSLLAADIDGAAGAPGTTALPPPGTPEYVLNLGLNLLSLWRVTPNFTADTLTVTGPTSIRIGRFTFPCSGGGSCIPQPGTTQVLASRGDRLMYRLAYRNFGSHASLVANHTVATSAGPTGLRWYELRDSGAGPKVYQKGTFAPADGLYRWMGSAAMDKQGNLAIGYSVSNGSSTFPSIRLAARAAADPLGTLTSEQVIWNGSASQVGQGQLGRLHQHERRSGRRLHDVVPQPVPDSAGRLQLEHARD